MGSTFFKGYEISKLMLGTVQLGMDYGIANSNGKPGKKDSFNLLNHALQNGISSLDTARHYGSEEIIGESGLSNNYAVVSKFKLSKAELISKDEAIKAAIKSVKMSCQALKLSQLPFCLFHQDKDHPLEKVADLLPAVLSALKNEGLIAIGGISVYYPNELLLINGLDNIEAVQVPMNVFDLRVLKNGSLQKLAAHNTAVFIRSVFLQGLLLMDPLKLPEYLQDAKKYLLLLSDLSKSSGISLGQLVFSYVRDTPGVTSLVIGAENPHQITQNTKLLDGPALSDRTRQSIEELFMDIPERLITPGIWTI